MTALPVSPDSLNNVARLGCDLWQSCRSAKGQFERVGREAFAMKTAVELVALELEDKQSPLNKLDADSTTKTHYKQLGMHVGNCKQALQAAHDCLRKYKKMATWQQLRWGWHGKEEVDSLVADLSSVATQLDSFVGALNMKDTGKVLGRIGRVEQLLDQNAGNETAAVDTIMADVMITGMASQNFEKYRNSITTYAQEVSKTAKASTSSAKKNKAESPCERKKSDATVSFTSTRLQKRSQSADTTESITTPDFKRSRSYNLPPDNKSNNSNNSTTTTTTKTEPPTLECWLIQIKAGNFTFLAWQKSGKESQPRGQSQLEEMARQFRTSKSSKYKDEYDLVGWVVEDRQKAELDPEDHVWRPYATKLERKGGGFLLDFGVEEQAMVIISRSLTPSAQLRADAEERASLATKDAARRRAKAEAAELKKKAKVELARRKSEDATIEKAAKEQKEKIKRRAEVKHLKQQVAMLRLNQQPTLADKPEAIAEKKRKEKMAREKAERDRLAEREERAANLRKVQVALGVHGGLLQEFDAKGKGKEKEKEKEMEIWTGLRPSTAYGRCGVEGRLQVSGKMFEMHPSALV